MAVKVLPMKRTMTPIMHTIHKMFTLYLILSSLIVGPAKSHQCPAKCDRSLCNLDKPCPGNVVLDMCNCCHECAKQANESCGGKYSYEGKCDEGLGLGCFISPLAGSHLTGQETGVCAEIPRQEKSGTSYRKLSMTSTSDDDSDSYEDDDTCSQIKCEELMSMEDSPTGDKLICPGDSLVRPNQTAASIVERCCNSHSGQWSPSMTCQCLPCRTVTPMEQFACPPRSFPILMVAGDMTPGRCCDMYECVEKEKFCSTIQCNDDSHSSSSSSSSAAAFVDDTDYGSEEPHRCPSDSVEVEPDSNFDMCCPRNRGCTCKPRSSCLSLDLVCPSGTTKRILEHGNGVPGTCCSKFDCLNVTLALVTPCNYDGKTFESGASWVVDSCTNCTCDSGLAKCVKTHCPESATRCEWIGQPDDGSCCPVCKGCVSSSEKNQNGGFHANGESWKKDSCTSCRCEHGQTYCMAQFCDTKCAKPRLVEGRCCPVCDEDQNIALLPPHCKPLKNCSFTCSKGYVRDRDLCPVCECSNGNENDGGNTIIDICDLDCGSSGYAVDPLTGNRLCHCAAPYGSGTREPSSCPSLINCSRQCLYGYGHDKFGCLKCRCNRCPVFECSKKCPAGYQKNDDGCRICKCNDSGVFSPTHSDSHKSNKVPGSRGRPCISANSRQLTDGQTWWDGCRKCFCHHGYEMCELVTCPPIRCTNPIMEPGSCCLTCPHSEPPKMLEGSGTCQSSDGRYFVDGETWSLDQCTQCICHMGVPLCTIDTCPPILCHHPVKLDGSCCPVCRHPTGPSQPRLPSSRHHLSKNRQCVTSNGTKSSNGDFWRVSPCQSCVCRDGQINCFSQTCPILGCNRTVLKKGQCCPSCLDNAVQYCVYNGLNYDNGESWLVDDCTTCACVDGHVLCIMSICERLTCLKPVSVLGNCCSICPNKSSTCPDKDNPGLSSPGAETGRSINVTLVIILITVIAILAFAIIILLGMLLWLRPRLSRRLRRTSSATLPASLPSLNPLGLFGGRREHQPLNNEKSVSSSLLPLNSVSSMVANHQSAPGNQRSILLSGSPIHMNMMESTNSTQKLRLSTGDPTFDAPSLSAAISSMTTASLASSSLSSAAAKKRLSSLDSCSADDRLTASAEMIKVSAPDSKMHTDDDDENTLPPPLPRRRPPPNDPNDLYVVDVVVDNDDENALGDGAKRVTDFSDSYKRSTDLMNSSDVSLSEDGPPNANGVNAINLFRKTKNYSGNIDVELTRHLLSSSPTNAMPIHNRKSW